MTGGGTGGLQKALSQYAQASPGIGAANPQATPAQQPLAPWAQQILNSPAIGAMVGGGQQMPQARPMPMQPRPMMGPGMGPGPIGQLMGPTGGPQPMGQQVQQQNPMIGQLM